MLPLGLLKNRGRPDKSNGGESVQGQDGEADREEEGEVQ